MIYDITKRMRKKEPFKETLERYLERAKQNNYNERSKQEEEEYLFRFKLTLLCGFIDNVLKVREPSYDDKQEKRIRFMRKESIPTRNTVCLLSSSVIRKPDNE
jgi:hypothetical protein